MGVKVVGKEEHKWLALSSVCVILWYRTTTCNELSSAPPQIHLTVLLVLCERLRGDSVTCTFLADDNAGIAKFTAHHTFKFLTEESPSGCSLGRVNYSE